MSKQDKYTKSARGQQCQVRQPGICNRDPETVVLAHINGAGIGLKKSSIHGAYACHACHQFLDGGYVKKMNRHARDLLHLEAVIRTQQIMIDEGVLVL